jgi:FKBP-type peptidyl-prolyl cis-trans isomerase
MKVKRSCEDNERSFSKKRKGSGPRTVLDRIILGLRQIMKPAGAVAIQNQLIREFNYTNKKAINKALKEYSQDGEDDKPLCKIGARYWLTGEPVPEDDIKVTIKKSTGGKEDPEHEGGVSNGDMVTISYKLFLPASEGGTPRKFVEGAQHFSFQQSAGDVIKGFEQGVKGMQVGEKRVLYVPWQLAYGKRGSKPDIPSMADLEFEIVLLGKR